MNCPSCSTPCEPTGKKTQLGYDKFRCDSCDKKFNERTGTPFNFVEYPTDIVLLVVRWRLRYKLSLRDLVEMFLDRGIKFSHETVREWQERYAYLMNDKLRAHRRVHGKTGPSWYVDETYVKVKARWCYLYRAIDRQGNLVDTMLSETRDMEAAKQFFESAKIAVGGSPLRTTSDGNDAYPRAVKEVLGSEVLHRTNRYLTNRIEQDHRGIKQRYYPMRGFKNFDSAALFCQAHDELRDFFRFRTKVNERVPLAERRRIYVSRLAELNAMMMAA